MWYRLAFPWGRQSNRETTRENVFYAGCLRDYLRAFFFIMIYFYLYNNKINARVLIGQSAMVYCAGKPMEKSRVL